MRFFNVSKTTRTATISGIAICVLGDETLLNAALRQGLAFPNSCRVGACGTCKCRLTEGRIRPLTEFSHVLSEQEMEQGMILACQSIPQSPVSIEVKLVEQGQRGSAPRSGNAQARLDRTSQSPAPVVANVFQYLKYFMFHLVGLFSVVTILSGGTYISAGLLAVLFFYIAGDAFLGDDTSTPTFTHPRVLTVQLWLALPLLALIVFAALWSVSAGDALGFGQWLTQMTGVDLLAARGGTGLGGHLSTLVVTGLMIGLIGTITGHELTHRTWEPVSLLVGRWLLAFSFDTSFSIEHVYGHHRYVSTLQDPATAPRGRNVYHHIAASTIKGNISAWQIEARRLGRKGQRVISFHNAVIRGYLMSVLLVICAALIGGAPTALFLIACAVFGKSLLEIVNYMEHYGLVRHPASRVEPRHSWNTNRRISSWTMFNLTRHSHHHAQGSVPYHALKPFPKAPMMISGYLTTILIALIPPLWQGLMIPRLQAWDRDHATAPERELVALANARSGLKALQRRE